MGKSRPKDGSREVFYFFTRTFVLYISCVKYKSRSAWLRYWSLILVFDFFLNWSLKLCNFLYGCSLWFDNLILKIDLWNCVMLNMDALRAVLIRKNVNNKGRNRNILYEWMDLLHSFLHQIILFSSKNECRNSVMS